MQFFFATPKHLHRVHSHFFMVVLGVAEGGFLFAHSHVSSVSIEVGTGFCPIWGIWRGAGTPATSQMRCWLLPNGRIFPAAAGLLCVGLAYCACAFHIVRTLAQRRLFPLCRTYTRCRGRKPHTAATRASRCGAGARHTRRVDSDDFFHGGKIGTIDPFQADEALAVTLSE